MNRTERDKRDAGLTLIELMVATAILAIVLTFVMDSFSDQQRTYSFAEQSIESQQNLRAIVDLIEREVRLAGFLVPESAAFCALDSTTGSDQLWISDTEPIDPTNVASATLGARITSGYLNAVGAQTWVLDSTTVDLDGDGSFYFDNDGNGTPESDFLTNGGFILTDTNNPDRGNACGIVTNGSPTSFQVNVLAGGFTPGIAADANLIVVPAAHYRLIAGLQLQRNQSLLTRGVEDFQVGFFVDRDDDGTIDTTPTHEYPGSPGGGTFSAAAEDVTEIREVEFTLVLRTRGEDETFTGGAFRITGNRSDPGLPADGFRRRIQMVRVAPRNVGSRGGI